jgi:hypothetical protein
MAALKAALGAIERHCGFPTSRTANIARRLQEGGLLPFGRPGLAPDLDIGDFATLLIGIATDTGLRTTAETTRRYADLPPHGIDLTGAPNSIYPRTAHEQLDLLIEHAVTGDQTSDLTTGTVVNVCLSWPEITFRHRDDGTVRRFQPIGTVPGHWQAINHRRSVEISGLALHYAARAIFRDQIK